MIRSRCRHEGALEILRVRLGAQRAALASVIASASPEALSRSPSPGRWSARENLAHLARHHAVMLERMERILQASNVTLPRYRAEDDELWPGWKDSSADELLRRLDALRTELIEKLDGLSAADLDRSARHPAFGHMTLLEWVDFFLLHEAHHLYVMKTQLAATTSE